MGFSRLRSRDMEIVGIVGVLRRAEVLSENVSVAIEGTL